MTDPDRVNVHEGAEELVHIQLDLQHGHGLLELRVVATGAIYGFWDVFKHEVEVHFVFLLRLASVRPLLSLSWRLRRGRALTLSPLE